MPVFPIAACILALDIAIITVDALRAFPIVNPLDFSLSATNAHLGFALAHSNFTLDCTSFISSF